MKNPWSLFFVFLVLSVLGMWWLIVPAMILGSIFFGAQKDKYQPRSRTRRSQAPKTRLSSRQSGAINDALANYFADHERLAILEEINLRPEKAEYENLRSLLLFKGDDCICALEEFGERYPKIYNEVLDMLIEFSKQPASARNKKTEEVIIQEEEAVETVTQPEEQEVPEPQINQAEVYIERINALNTGIVDENITNGLYQTCSLLKHLSIAEKKFPENKDKLNKLYQYYMPILVDILENYQNLKDTAQDHEDFKTTADRLNKTIILINEAMKTISSTMCEDDLMNLSADITTLEALLKKDGLVQEGTLSSVKVK